MRVFAIWVELPKDVTVQCPHHANARHHGRPVILDDEEQRFDRSLPFLEMLFDLGSFWIYLAASSRVTIWRPRGSGIGSSNGRFQPVAAIR
jgi:hypothetical protein